MLESKNNPTGWRATYAARRRIRRWRDASRTTNDTRHNYELTLQCTPAWDIRLVRGMLHLRHYYPDLERMADSNGWMRWERLSADDLSKAAQ